MTYREHRKLIDDSGNTSCLLFKLTVSPLEAEKPGALDRQNEYLQAVSRYPASRLYFFDESSVIKTTGNRKYGNAKVGERTLIEVQCYTSNATFTINLLHSVVSVDYFNILQGQSNGLELLIFFDEALQVDRADGSAALELGDVVVMDNCGFHHAQQIDPLLRNVLNACGIELNYQPSLSPHLNTVHVSTVSTKSNNFFNCTSYWQ